MDRQLKISEEQLLSIGFKKEISEADEMNDPRSYFTIPIINGSFYYNSCQTEYVWYCKMIVGDASNHVLLDITTKPMLFAVLQAFRVDFKIIITD